MRLLSAALLAAAFAGLAGSATRADEKTEPKEGTPAAQLAAIKKDAAEANKRLMKQFREAKDADEKGKVRDEAMKLFPGFAEKAVALAEANPNDDAALDALDFASQQPTGPKLAEKAIAMLAQKSTNKAVKAGALFKLGAAKAGEADETAGDDAKQAEVMTKEAEKLLVQAEALAKDAPAAKVGGQPLAKAIDDELKAIRTLSVGKTAPDVAATTLDGKKVKLSDYKGKVVVVDIWATWCGPCRAMIPHERELVKKLEGKPFTLISVSADDKKDTLEEFLKETPMPWTHWWDGRESEVLKAFNVRFFPTIYVIDAKGVIRYKHVRGEKMDAAVEALLKEAEQTKG